AAITTIRTRWCAAATASFRWTSTFRAVRPPPRRCSTASSSCRTRSGEPIPSPGDVPHMADRLSALEQELRAAFGDRLRGVMARLGEITIEVGAADLIEVARRLRDEPPLRFDQLSDLCGVDYSTWGNGARTGPRFAVVSHLLSIPNNQRLRLR